ncbi:translation initiation factor IF-2 [Pseudobdellovibrio sp. HCB154]|uniref:translation initiation factor IF-2 n=1 Tax=Pseudobdellovibrio sp. HCB154 TaxID=3386277 RepID=UPI0039174EAB
MSNPKVFEFAKEIGMTPLALMDKIKEWHLPIKNHMAELEPDMLATLKAKLSAPAEPAAEEKPKKTATKKAAAPKAAAATKTAATKTTTKKAAAVAEAPAPEAPKSSVIRRKTKEAEPVAEVKARVISKPEETAEVVAEEVAPVQAAPVVEVEQKVEPKIETAPVAPAPAAAVAAPAATPAAPASPAPVARKKEVAIGDSGVASSTAVASKRNIIGRMDLSRVQAPPGATNTGGYQGNRQGGGFQPRGPGGGGGFQRGPGGPGGGGGFSGPRPAGAGGGRNIRPGFVAQQTIPEPGATPFNNDAHRDRDKKARTFTQSGGMSAKEKEQEELVSSFNAVEFRKREMVFQPKKKQAVLNRDAMKTQITTPKASKRVLKVNGKIKLGDMALEMGLKAAQIIKVLMKSGVMANVNTDLDFDTVALTVPDFGWEAENTFKTAEDVVVETAFGDLDADLIIRPPVVTVMGHVDHGKTSLLDAIRQADVAGGEAGGITQHIGAYSVKAPDGSLITFLDTPGHEAFTAMRARGANATDIAIIVVAADDGMMPQTAEAINHAKAAGVPMIVAVNKMDKPGANPDRIKQQLTELEIVPEEWGGNTIFVEVSALKKTGIDTLLENIKLLAEVAELKANPERSGTGLVIEAKLEKGKGPVATILVKDGHVKVGQYIVAGPMKGRVKSLTNDKGERVDRVNPGMPVEVLGLEGVPGAGDRFDVVKDEKTAEEVVQIRKDIILKEKEVSKKVSLEDLFSKVTQGEVKDLNIILKTDVQGSLEAITGMLSKANSLEVKTKVIHSGVGGVNENDVLLAQTSKGVVIGFNVRPDSNAQAKAKQLGVDIRTYTIVYEMMDDIKKAMQGLLAPQIVEKAVGSAEVRNTFTVPKIGMIAGCFVTSGKIQRSNMLRLVREGKIVYEGKVSSLKRFKDDAKEVSEGFECGIGIENFNDIKVGDVIEAYLKEEIARELTPIK